MKVGKRKSGRQKMGMNGLKGDKAIEKFRDYRKRRN